MNGASEDSANIDMTAMVEIEPLTKCDLVMRVSPKIFFKNYQKMSLKNYFLSIKENQ